MTPPSRKPATPRAGEVEPADKPSKFTVLLDAETAATFDALQLQLRRQLKHRIEKSTILRALIALTADDATLREQLTAEIRRQQ